LLREQVLPGQGTQIVAFFGGVDVCMTGVLDVRIDSGELA